MIKIEVLDVDQRKKIVESKKNSKELCTFTTEIDGQTKNLKVYNIPIDALLYRMNNGRVDSQQLSHIKKNKLPKNFFAKGQENDEAHNILHTILFKMVTASTEDENIYEELKSIKKFDQNNPIVVSNKLVVINGNRRLSSLRELYYSPNGKSEYSNYEKVPCAIIFEDLNEQDTVMTEVRFQMKKDFKEDYDWINRGRLIRKLLNEPYKYSENDISHFTRMKLSDIDKTKRALTLAEEYLDEENESENYEIVLDQEQLWKNKAEWQKKNRKVNKSIWFLQDNISKKIVSKGKELKKEGSGRLYEIHNKLCLEDGPIVVTEILKKHYGKHIKKETKENKTLNILGKPINDKFEQAASDLKQMLPHIKKLDAQKLLEIGKEIEANKDEGYIEKSLSNMISDLSTIDSRQIPTSRFNGIKKLVNKLEEKLKNYSKKFQKGEKLN